MSEFGESRAPLPFEALPMEEKVKAILGHVEEPVSREFALEMAGINTEELNETEEAKIDTIFNSSDVVTSTVNEETRYVLSDQGKAALGNIDSKSVHKTITDHLMKNLFGEGMPDFI